MEYFDDPSELASYDSQADAIAAVEEGLAQGRGGATKVYRIDIPGKDETVFGVALNDSGCSGDEYIMSRVDKSPVRSTAHLPYEILEYSFLTAMSTPCMHVSALPSVGLICR